MFANSATGRCLLDDAARVHHGDLVGSTCDDAEVVGDEDHRHVAVTLLLCEQIEDLVLNRDVERGGRLVGEEEVRTACERDRDAHALAHAARHLMGVVLETGPRARGCGPNARARSLGRVPRSC